MIAGACIFLWNPPRNLLICSPLNMASKSKKKQLELEKFLKQVEATDKNMVRSIARTKKELKKLRNQASNSN
jgi:hypothetical protein